MRERKKKRGRERNGEGRERQQPPLQKKDRGRDPMEEGEWAGLVS